MILEEDSTGRDDRKRHGARILKIAACLLILLAGGFIGYAVERNDPHYIPPQVFEYFAPLDAG